jgi:hypothetical protein
MLYMYRTVQIQLSGLFFFFSSSLLPAGRIYNAGTLHSAGGCRIRSRQKVFLSALIKGKFHKNLALISHLTSAHDP